MVGLDKIQEELLKPTLRTQIIDSMSISQGIIGKISFPHSCTMAGTPAASGQSVSYSHHVVVCLAYALL